MKIRLHYFLIASFLIVNSIPASSQSRFSGWLASFNSIKTGKKTSIHAEFQLRSSDQVNQIETILLRSGFNYHLKKNMVLTAGYGYILNRHPLNILSAYGHEHRIWQQFLVSHAIKKNQLSHRFRLEERYRERVVSTNGTTFFRDGYDYSTRFRYFVRDIIPFNNNPVFTNGLFAAIQNEVFVNVTDKKNVNGKFFDQNRFYVAAGYRFHKKFDLEIGYMNQHISGINKYSANNHILQLASYLRL